MYLNTTSSYYTGGVFYYSTINPTPTANITVNRSRLKLYQDNVYMKDGTSFEIELWNPRPNRVLAKIFINGNPVSGGGIIVNPGQRVYLERYLEVDRKFQFKTYEAENSSEGQAAIANNGLVSVIFYDEASDHQNWTLSSTDVTNLFVGSAINPMTFTSSNYNLINDLRPSSFTSQSLEDRHTPIKMNRKLSSQSVGNIETGRVQQGGQSNQRLVNTDGNFASFACAAYTVKILPESQKPSEIGDIRYYCTKCGRRWRSGENFCATCGTPRNN